MVYLDYSATTIVDKDVLNSFNKVIEDFPGNANSIHKLGMESKLLLDKATEQVACLLKVKPSEVIFTSGASESNNLAIKGIIDAFPNRGKHIITTKLEHSSVLETLKYLETKGYIIDYVKLDNEGKVDLNDFANSTVVAGLEGKEIAFGFRPEHVTLCGNNKPAGAVTLNCKVELTELLGDNTNVYIDIDGINSILKIDPHMTPEIDSDISFAINYDHIYLFDTETENVIRKNK